MGENEIIEQIKKMSLSEKYIQNKEILKTIYIVMKSKNITH